MSSTSRCAPGRRAATVVSSPSHFPPWASAKIRSKLPTRRVTSTASPIRSVTQDGQGCCAASAAVAASISTVTTSTSSRPCRPCVIQAVPTPVPVPSSSTRPFAGTAAARTASSLPVPGSHDMVNPACSARSAAMRTGSGSMPGVYGDISRIKVTYAWLICRRCSGGTTGILLFCAARGANTATNVLSSRLVRGTRSRNAVNRRADAEDPIVADPAVDATAVVADLCPLPRGIEGRNQLQVHRAGGTGKDDMSHIGQIR
jgi:hypothetical protein